MRGRSKEHALASLPRHNKACSGRPYTQHTPHTQAELRKQKKDIGQMVLCAEGC